MYLGIDVGGTFTDGVLIKDNYVVKACKLPTYNNALLASILETLDKLLENVTNDELKRIVVSTTLMTNLIAENKYEPTGLLLFPGPGINFNEYKFPFISGIVQGGVDFQGRVIEKIDEKEIVEKVGQLVNKGIVNLGIISKFSPRNPEIELKAEKIVKNHFPDLNLQTGYKISGHLNFIRRSMSTGLFLACQKTFEDFVTTLKDALAQRNITCPAFILKADGGIIPLQSAHSFAVDTILSGPAASCFGAKALLEDNSSAIVIDIGGTTTDLSLILDSKPLFASKGVKIKDIYTHVRALAVRSIPVGGDTGIQIINEEIKLTFRRQGSPACLGGNQPTITDCLRALNLTSLGDKDKAIDSLKPLAESLNNSVKDVAEDTLNLVVSLIEEAVLKMLEVWQEEPAYRIWQLLNPNNIKPEVLITLGGPGGPLGLLLSQKLKLKPVHFPLCSVANAIGAALALPTYEGLVRVNTENKEVSTSWGDFSRIEQFTAQKISQEKAASLALKMFNSYLEKKDVKKAPKIYQHEVFNMVRGWSTTGQIHEIKIGIPPQILGLIENKECSFDE